MTEINKLNLKAKKVTTCWHHSLVLFEDDKGKESLYSIGINKHKQMGVTEEQLGETDAQKKKPFRSIPTFNDVKIADFCNGEQSSLVIIECDAAKPSEKIYQHELPDGSKCQGLLHFYKKGDQW